jgi:spermidine/putrescine transport system permease protein
MGVKLRRFPQVIRDQVIRTISQRWLLLHAALGFAFLYLPILILVVYSFNNSRGNAVWRGFTVRWYESLLQGGDALGLGTNAGTNVGGSIWTALHNSLLVATVSTVLSTGLGTLLAIAMERYRFRGRQAVEALIYLPVIIPEITMGISLLVFFTLLFRSWETLTGIRINLGFPTMIIGHVAFSVSFVAIIVRARLADLDPAFEEVAMDLGANEWRTLWRITFPLLSPAILSSALLAFTLSLDDFVVTFFTTGVGSTTLPLFVYSMIRFSVTPAINAISTLMLLASMMLVVAALVSERSSKLSRDRPQLSP